MYHAHFGLARALFGEGIAADAAVFRTVRHDRLIAQFKLALASPTSSIVLQGPAGVGKTTLTATALRASTTRLAIAWVNGMATNAAELLELVLVELGISTLRTTRIERLQLWRQFLSEMRATDSRLFIVAERTEDLSAEVLHTLDQLTAPDAIGNPGANLVLLGHPGIHEHLAAPLLDSLRQRIRLRAELAPFAEAELEDFLRHQVACAGGHYDRIFAPGTAAALHRYSGGVARLATTLCESALDVAAEEWQKQLTPEVVAKTATSLLGLADTAPAARPAPARVEFSAAAEPRPISPATPAAAPAERPAQSRVTIPAIPAPAPAPTAARPAPQPPPTPNAFAAEYDGSATDVADVALADFPILTDAVETPPLATPAKPAAPAVAKEAGPAPFAAAPPPAKAPAAAPSVTASAPSSPARAPTAAAAAARPASRAEPVPAVPRPTSKPTVSATSPAPQPAASSPLAAATAQRPAAAKPAAPQAAPAAAASPAPAAQATRGPPPPDPTAEDVLRQTQTMRAISVAKSIDDISEVDAETLFSDAELDLVAAALASAAEWADEEETAEALQPAPAKPATAKTMPPDDDLLGLFGLGDDAPLELIDDSVDPNDRARKTAAR